jgi:hypothetical protein
VTEDLRGLQSHKIITISLQAAPQRVLKNRRIKISPEKNNTKALSNERAFLYRIFRFKNGYSTHDSKIFKYKGVWVLKKNLDYRAGITNLIFYPCQGLKP